MGSKKKNVGLFTTALTVAAITAIPSVASAAQFSDIQGNSHETAILKLVDMGLIYGYSDGTFKPNKALTHSDVVKLIGRYLTQNGYDIPADYQTNIRFKDLSSYSENGLLQYAALVKDLGIFDGNNGELQPAEKMTRENMAVVLANTLSAVHQFDYVTHVNNLSFENEIIDLEKAKESARSAIQVLDYYDITKVDVFNPKSTLTRGQFASFLNTLINVKNANLSVIEVKVLSANEVSVTLSDRTTHTVTLSKPLTGDGQETVQFNINGIQYDASVNYQIIDKEEPVKDSETTRFIVESDEFLLGVTPDGRVIVEDDADIKVFGFINDVKVELPISAYTITSDSDYLKINGKVVTPDYDAIQADGVLDEVTDQLEADIVVTINNTGETIKHTLTLTQKDVKVNDSFKVIDNNSISGKVLDDIDIEITESDLELTASDIFNEILEDGHFEIIDQYGNDYRSFNPATGEVTFFDGSTDFIRPIISEISTANDDYSISSNGTSSLRISLGENGLNKGDSFKVTLSIDEQSLTIRAYVR
nr:S-layer homology domain-containing protein [Lysinibacillus timonensis]